MSELKKLYESKSDPIAANKTDKNKLAVKSENKEGEEIEDGQIMETVVKCDNNGKRKVEKVEEAIIGDDDKRRKLNKMDKTEGDAEIPKELTADRIINP